MEDQTIGTVLPHLLQLGLTLKATAFMMVRPMSFAVFFIPFAIAFGRSFLIRFAISLPFAFILFPAFINETLPFLEGPVFDQWAFLGRDFVIGAVLGMVASLPFWTIRFAAGFIDAYRGEANPTLHEETGATLTTTSVLFNVTAILVFAQSGGFAHLFNTIYWTYSVWPIGAEVILPSFLDTRGLLSIMDEVFFYIIVISLPIIAIMVCVEFAVSFVEKMFKKSAVSSLNTAIKSLAYVLILPVYMVVFIATANDKVSLVHELKPLIEAIGP